MIAEGLSGQAGDDEGRDLTVDAMNAAAERLSGRYPLEASAVRYPEGGWVVDGFMVWTGPVETAGGTEWHGETVMVPVRRRRRLLGRWFGPWQEVQPVAAAAAEVGAVGRTASPDVPPREP